MRASGVVCAAGGHCHSARRLLGGDGGFAPVASSSPAPASLDAQHARLERVLCATTAVLFAASLSCLALSALFACFRAARRPERPPDAEPEPPAPSSDAAETKRALEEIPVVVVQVRNDPDRSCVEGAEEEAAAAGGDEECAVCLAAYAGGEEVRVLPGCGHGFHRECVDRWLLTRAPTCPVCRATVVAASSKGRHAKECATGDTVSRADS